MGKILKGRLFVNLKMMRAEDFQNFVAKIVEKATILKDKYTEEKNAPVCYACIFSQSNDEFNMFSDMTRKIGSITKETQNGPIFKIIPISTVSGQLKLLKIRQPDKSKPEQGYADFTIANYDDFKKKHCSQNRFRLINRKGYEMIELMDQEFNVRTYFPNPPLDKLLNI